MEKVEALWHYKFSLAFENTNEEDYVTEKFFQSLVAGRCDEAIEPSPDPKVVPELKEAPMTRSKARRLREGFNLAVESLLSTMELGDAFKTEPQEQYTRDSPKGPDLDIMEGFARLSLKESRPQLESGIHVYLAGNGAQNTKNLEEAASDPQDTTVPRLGAASEPTRPKEEHEEGRMKILEELAGHDVDRTLDELNIKTNEGNLKANERINEITSKPTAGRNQVFSIYTICAGNMGVS